MGRPYDTLEEARAKRRNGEKIQFDEKTEKFHNVRACPKKTNKGTRKPPVSHRVRGPGPDSRGYDLG